MATFLQLYGRVNRYTDTSDTTTAKDHVNDAYAELVQISHAKIASASKVLTIGQGSYTISTDFSLSDVLEILQVTYTSAGAGVTAYPLQPVGFEEILRYRVNTNTGYIRCYTIVGLDNFEIYPAPDSAGTLVITYVQAPTALSADGDLPSALPTRFHNLIAIGATLRMIDEEASEDYPTWQARWDDGCQRLRAWMVSRVGATPRRSMVGYPSRIPGIPHDRSAYWSDPDS